MTETFQRGGRGRVWRMPDRSSPEIQQESSLVAIVGGDSGDQRSEEVRGQGGCGNYIPSSLEVRVESKPTPIDRLGVWCCK